MIILDYLEKSHTINGEYYAGQLMRLCQEIASKKVARKTDSRSSALEGQRPCPYHTSQVAMAAATECGFESLTHPSYSRDMTPSNFYLFPTLKSHLRGTQYGSNRGVIEAVNECLGDQERAFFY